MQFYKDGFYPGDPAIIPAAGGSALGHQKPDEVDVLIVGSGPAGNLLAAYLSQFPEISTCIVERRTGRLAASLWVVEFLVTMQESVTASLGRLKTGEHHPLDAGVEEFHRVLAEVATIR